MLSPLLFFEKTAIIVAGISVVRTLRAVEDIRQEQLWEAKQREAMIEGNEARRLFDFDQHLMMRELGNVLYNFCQDRNDPDIATQLKVLLGEYENGGGLRNFRHFFKQRRIPSTSVWKFVVRHSTIYAPLYAHAGALHLALQLNMRRELGGNRKDNPLEFAMKDNWVVVYVILHFMETTPLRYLPLTIDDTGKPFISSESTQMNYAWENALYIKRTAGGFGIGPTNRRKEDVFKQLVLSSTSTLNPCLTHPARGVLASLANILSQLPSCCPIHIKLCEASIDILRNIPNDGSCLSLLCGSNYRGLKERLYAKSWGEKKNGNICPEACTPPLGLFMDTPCHCDNNKHKTIRDVNVALSVAIVRQMDYVDCLWKQCRSVFCTDEIAVLICDFVSFHSR